MTRLRDRLAEGLAYRLPRRVVYWAIIRAAAATIKGDEEVPGVPVMDVLQRWGKVAGMPGHGD